MLVHSKVNFGEVASTICRAGGDITSIDVIRPGQDSSIRDITVHIAEIAEAFLIEMPKMFSAWPRIVSFLLWPTRIRR
ncbi:UNVERIFIED_CONTAM: hypothetical protein ABIC26_001112 [Paenibacillus sp. PvR008]